MSQGKRAPHGICDYCMIRPAYKSHSDSSESCERCTRKMYTVDPFVGKPKQPRNMPWKCGSGKKFKKCCMHKELTHEFD